MKSNPKDDAENKAERLAESYKATTTITDCIDTLANEMLNRGFHMHPDPLGGFSGFAVYKEASIGIAGIDFPPGFFYWQKCNPASEIDKSSFNIQLRKICERYIAAANDEEDKYTARQWREVMISFIDRSSVNNNAVRQAVGVNTPPLPTTITLSGKAGGYQVVPQASWFPSQVQALDARKLLSILPDAEAEQLMLILGRLMCGTKFSQTMEGILEHTARSYAILVGKDPGMGKSTLVGHIKRMIVALGYTTAEISTDFNRFGWRRIALSSLATVDDLTEETQRKMIQNGYVKTVVSNDRLSVEDKGVDAIDVQSKTVIIGCSNDSHYGHFIGMDAGALSRLNLLATKNRSDIAKDNNLDPSDKAAVESFLLPTYWERLATELDTTPDALCCYLLARSAEKFLTACGYKLDEYGDLQKVSKPTLYEDTLANRARFRIMPSLTHAEEVTRVTATLCSLAVREADSEDVAKRLERAIERADFCAPLLLGFFEVCIGNQTYSDSLSDLNATHVAASCVVSLSERIRDIEGTIAGKTSEAAFESAIKELKSVHGFGYPHRSSNYQENWREATRNHDSRLKTWEAANPKVTSKTRLAIARVTEYLLKLA